MIRKAKKKEIQQILTLTRACAQQMKSQNIFQWNENYPSLDAFNHDLKRNELFVLILKEIIVGCITITTKIDKEYLQIKWLTPSKNNLYIHRLAIHPDFQGKGLAQLLMDFAENFALENNYSSIRLDTFSGNQRNQKFYELRGYKKLGEIHFPNQSEDSFYCYELLCKK
jgi:ribosomal protein S18 acetylase RimI-like enzyme